MSKKNRILTIDPGTRNIGFAFFEKGELIHYGVKTVPSTVSPRMTMKEARKTVLRLTSDFKPEILTVEKTYIANNRSSMLLNVLTADVRTLGKRKGLQVQSIATNTVRKYICGNGAAGKEEAARAVTARYPELKAYLSQDRKWKNEFHGNMFDAVGLGLFAMNHQAGSIEGSL